MIDKLIVNSFIYRNEKHALNPDKKLNLDDLKTDRLFTQFEQICSHKVVETFFREVELNKLEVFFKIPSLGIYNQLKHGKSYDTVMNRVLRDVFFSEFQEKLDIHYHEMYDNNLILPVFTSRLHQQFQKIIDGKTRYCKIDGDDLEKLKILYEILQDPEKIPVLKVK
jgi:hypothetical protein